jgi:hypothetical protein
MTDFSQISGLNECSIQIFSQKLEQVFEVMPELWTSSYGTERILIFESGDDTGIRIDAATKTLTFPTSIREGKANAVFTFHGAGLHAFLSGISLASLQEDSLLVCSGELTDIFKASFFLDSIAKSLSSTHNVSSSFLH